MRPTKSSSSLLSIAGIVRSSSSWAWALRVGTNQQFYRSKTYSTWSSRIMMMSSHSHRRRFATKVLFQSVMNMPPFLESPYQDFLPFAKSAMEFINDSPDPFHAVHSATIALKQAGFLEWKDHVDGNDDDDDIDFNKNKTTQTIVPGGKYFFTRNKSTLVAFAIGKKYRPGNAFKIIGSHTDSPNLRVKPNSKRGGASSSTTSRSEGETIQIGVECYGGGLWHTWFDRDLGVSGRVFFKDIETEKIRQKLVKIGKPLLRIPNLAIHLQTTKEREAFAINKEDHLSPILATAVKESLTNKSRLEESKEDENGFDNSEWLKCQEPLLVQILASTLGVETKHVVDFELSLFDVQPASFGGIHSEFVHSSRLDNLVSCFLSLRALVDHGESGLETDGDISMIAMFDHEEVGSGSATGAGSPIMAEAVRRIYHVLSPKLDNPVTYDNAIQKSFVLSVDQAHAVHPNYALKHEKNHGPKMNAGVVIKRNSNQRYATNGQTGLIMREIAKKAGLPPLQEFVVRNDCACGSTIGPIVSAATGIRAIDIGCPQLSMHSIRETMGVKDLTLGRDLFRAFFAHFSSVDELIEK